MLVCVVSFVLCLLSACIACSMDACDTGSLIPPTLEKRKRCILKAERGGKGQPRRSNVRLKRQIRRKKAREKWLIAEARRLNPNPRLTMKTRKPSPRRKRYNPINLGIFWVALAVAFQSAFGTGRDTAPELLGVLSGAPPPPLTKLPSKSATFRGTTAQPVPWSANDRSNPCAGTGTYASVPVAPRGARILRSPCKASVLDPSRT